MRISDWSSDVCSSDLRRCRAGGHPPRCHRSRCRWPARLPNRDRAAPIRNRPFVARAGNDETVGLALFAHQGVRSAQPGDRKSVVSGKRVSVRVDLGGRRVIKKKKKKKKKQQKT